PDHDVHSFPTRRSSDLEFTIVDTGGYVQGEDYLIESGIREQVLIAIEEATVVLFMVDAKTGITDQDDEVAKILRRSKKPVYVVRSEEHTSELQSRFDPV